MAEGSDATPAIVAHNLRLGAELECVLGVLEAAEVDCIVLKGIPLMRRIGEPLGARRVIDNDILVRREDAMRAFEALTKAGYTSFGARRIEHDLRTNFEHPLVRPDGSGGYLVCELHWRAFPEALFRVPEETVWRRVEWLEVGATPARVFEPLLQLLHVVSHAFQHELCEPRTLAVVGAAWTRWNAEIPVSELRAMARRFRMEPALEYALVLAKDLGHTTALVLPMTSPRARLLRRATGAARMAVPADTRFPERYLRILATLSLLSHDKALAYGLGRAIPPPDAHVSERGWPSVLWHYVVRPARPVMRSFGWQPRDAVDGGKGDGYGPLAPFSPHVVVRYLGVYRSLAETYREHSLDALLVVLEGAIPGAREPIPLADLARSIRVAERVAPRFGRTPNTCLFRSLARFAVLCAHGYEPRFVLGVPPTPDHPGHAWVELDGAPFLERSKPLFAPILAHTARSRGDIRVLAHHA